MKTVESELQTILIVEDDLVLSALMKDLIEGFGYDVAVAVSCLQAEDILREEGEFNLLLTDVRMRGGFDGFELAKRAREMYPRISVLYISGNANYSPEEMGEVPAPILQKPVRPAVLEESISRAIGVATQ